MKFKFCVGTNRVGSDVEEIVEIDDSEIQDCIDNGGSEEDAIIEVFQEWVWQNIDAYYRKI